MASTLKEKMDAKAKATQEFREKWHGIKDPSGKIISSPTATKTDVVKALLNSNNQHFGTDTRNLEQYLTERDYDISAISAGEDTIPENIFMPNKQQELRKEIREQTVALETSSSWRLGSTVFTTFPKSSRNLQNASNGNFDDYAYFDIDRTTHRGIGGMSQQYLTVNFDKTYVATQFQYRVSGQGWHQQDVKLKLEHYDTSSQQWITDKIITSINQKSPETFTISTSPVNSNAMRVGFVGDKGANEGDHVLRVYELRMYATSNPNAPSKETIENLNHELAKIQDENTIRATIDKTPATIIPEIPKSSINLLPIILIAVVGLIAIYLIRRKK